MPSKKWVCGLCGKPCSDWGSNPWPLAPNHEFPVCNDCNDIVIAMRMLADTYILPGKEYFDRECYENLRILEENGDSNAAHLREYFSKWFEGTNIDHLSKDNIEFSDNI